MVGIARARGCGTCRKRKIACGLEQPSCAQCIKSKRVCTGYRRYPIFISHQIPQNADSKIAALGEPAKMERKKDGPATPSVARKTGPPWDVGSFHQAASLCPPGRHVNATPAIRQQLLQEFLHHHLPNEEVGMPRRRIWLLRLPELPHMIPALEMSAMALCLAKLGEVHCDQALIHESLKLYNHGLRQLQTALWDPRLMFDDQTLAACITLAGYELSQCPNNSKDAYISHTVGCQTLVKLRGPEAHAHGLAHQIFVHFRAQGILYALDKREPTFLSEPVWREVPWRYETKTFFDKVYDLLAFAPEFLSQARLFDDLDIDGKLELALIMIPKCWDIDQELSALWASMEKSQLGPLFWPELAKTRPDRDDSEEGMVFPVAFHFPNLSVANSALIIWAVQTILWHGLKELYRLMSELKMAFATLDRVEEEVDPNSEMGKLRQVTKCSGDVFNLPPLEHRADFAVAARSIFQAVEFCMKDDMVDQGPKMLAAPLKIATETLRQYPSFKREVAFGDDAMEKVQQRSLRLLMFYTGTQT